MAGEFEPLNNNFVIVNADGTPTDYFIRWAQQKQIDIGEAITLPVLEEFLAAHTLQEGLGIQITPDGNLNSSPTIAADIQELLDSLTATRGAIIYRGLLGWEALPPDVAGYVLSTNGSGADPSWIAQSGGGGGGSGLRKGVRRVGKYYYADTCFPGSGSVAGTLNVNHLALYPYSLDVPIDALVVNVTTLGAGIDAVAGIYARRGGSGADRDLPGLLLAQSAVVSLGSTGNKEFVLPAAHTMTEMVWMAINISGAGPAFRSTNDGQINLGVEPSVSMNAGGVKRLRYASAYSATMPADLSAVPEASFLADTAGLTIVGRGA